MSVAAVQSLVSRLNHDWFVWKKEAFEKETFFVKDLNKIYETIRNESVIYDDDGKEIDDSTEIEIDINLSQYCWSDYYPECRSRQDYLDEAFPVDGWYISSKIISLIETTLNGVADIKASYTTVMTVITTVKETVMSLVSKCAESEYAEALNHFFIRFKNDLSAKYGYLKRIHNLTADYKPKLDFKINQEQLGALLYILNKAGVFANITPTDTDFINFCKDHFTFKHRTTRQQSVPTELRNKFNDAKDPLCPARDKVIQMLMDATQEYRMKG